MMKPTTFLICILITACTSSQTNSENNIDIPSPNVELTGTKDTQSQKPGDVLRLTKREIIDREGTGMVASTYLLPADWTVQDRLYWEYNDATVPIRLKAEMHSKDGSMSIQVFPDIRTSWNRGPAGVSGYPPPNGIINGMKDLIAAERKGKSVRYITEKVLRDQSQNTQQGRTTSQAAVIRVEYEDQGTVVEEEFYANLDVAYMMTPTVMGNMESYIWGASGMYACKARKGKLEECRKIAQTVAVSAQLTKPFYNRLVQVIQLLSDQVYARIYQAGQISKIISQTNDQMLANIDASYRQSQQARDRANDNFSDYIRGVDRYSDGGSEYQLPSGYSHAWVNDRGEYLLTNTTGYDPSRDFNGSWKQLERN